MNKEILKNFNLSIWYVYYFNVKEIIFTFLYCILYLMLSPMRLILISINKYYKNISIMDEVYHWNNEVWELKPIQIGIEKHSMFRLQDSKIGLLNFIPYTSGGGIIVIQQMFYDNIYTRKFLISLVKNLIIQPPVLRFKSFKESLLMTVELVFYIITLRFFLTDKLETILFATTMLEMNLYSALEEMGEDDFQKAIDYFKKKNISAFRFIRVEEVKKYKYNNYSKDSNER